MDTLNQQEYAYLAGLFDGEGCVFVTFKQRKNHLVLEKNLMISNTNLEVLEWCKSKLQTGYIVEQKDHSEKGYKNYYKIILTGRILYELLPELLKYSIIKKNQLDNLYKILLSRQQKKLGSSYTAYELKCFFSIKAEIQNNKDVIIVNNKEYTLETLLKNVSAIKDSQNNTYIEWNDSKLSLLGTEKDVDVARKLGVSRSVVTNKRKMLGIPRRGKSRLPNDKMLEVLELYKTNNFTQAELAKKFEVSRHIIYDVVSGRNKTY